MKQYSFPNEFMEEDETYDRGKKFFFSENICKKIKYFNEFST